MLTWSFWRWTTAKKLSTKAIRSRGLELKQLMTRIQNNKQTDQKKKLCLDHIVSDVDIDLVIGIIRPTQLVSYFSFFSTFQLIFIFPDQSRQRLLLRFRGEKKATQSCSNFELSSPQLKLIQPTVQFSIISQILHEKLEIGIN